MNGPAQRARLNFAAARLNAGCHGHPPQHHPTGEGEGGGVMFGACSREGITDTQVGLQEGMCDWPGMLAI